MVGIYKIENKVNGKVYIGESINIENRWSQHIKDLNENKHHSYKLQSDWNKYGEVNFIFEILLKVELSKVNPIKKALCLLKEEEYISNLNSITNGYNIKSNNINEACLKKECGLTQSYMKTFTDKFNKGHYTEIDGCLVEESYSIRDLAKGLGLGIYKLVDVLIELNYYTKDNKSFKLKYKNYTDIKISNISNKSLGSKLYKELLNELNSESLIK